MRWEVQIEKAKRVYWSGCGQIIENERGCFRQPAKVETLKYNANTYQGQKSNYGIYLLIF